MEIKTKGQSEAAISETMIKFEKDFMGRGPTEVKSYIIDDMILVRLKKVLTPAEERLAKMSDGLKLIKRTRVELLENSRELLEKLINEITGCQVKSLHTDISIKTGERIIIFVLKNNLENRFKKKTA